MLEEYGDYIKGKVIRDILSNGKVDHRLISKAIPDFDSAIDVRDFVRHMVVEGYLTGLVFIIDHKTGRVKYINYKNVGLTDKAFALDAREKENRRRRRERLWNERYMTI